MLNYILYLCRTKTQIRHKTMNKQNLGIILIVLGALMLILSYAFSLEDYNFYNIGALLIIIAGIVTHIIMTKRS
ncbi:MAG: hypothetical protein J6W03_06120 [Bacteroidaceae bacterium]|nr:hypothetical protein [Bacteroidaceae bacterium]